MGARRGPTPSADAKRRAEGRAAAAGEVEGARLLKKLFRSQLLRRYNKSEFMCIRLFLIAPRELLRPRVGRWL